jgi:hypothetical protein
MDTSSSVSGWQVTDRIGYRRLIKYEQLVLRSIVVVRCSHKEEDGRTNYIDSSNSIAALTEE